jgi:hypothetical protein
MTESEETILDSLYFLISFLKLKVQLKIDESVLKSEIMSMIEKGWVNFYCEIDGEMNPEINWKENITSLHLLISKKGLFEHNSR